MTSDETNGGPAQPSPSRPPSRRGEPSRRAQQPGPAPMTARERRRRIAALILLLLLLLMLALGAWYWYSTRMVPLPSLERDAELLNPPQYLFSISGSGANALERPVGVDVGPDGRVYVVDFGKRRVSVFDRSGRYLFSFKKVDGGDLGNPVHLQVQGNEVWVTDRRLRGIYVFDLDGKFKRRFEPKNEKDFKLDAARPRLRHQRAAARHRRRQHQEASAALLLRGRQSHGHDRQDPAGERAERRSGRLLLPERGRCGQGRPRLCLRRRQPPSPGLRRQGQVQAVRQHLRRAARHHDRCREAPVRGRRFGAPGRRLRS